MCERTYTWEPYCNGKWEEYDVLILDETTLAVQVQNCIGEILWAPKSCLLPESPVKNVGDIGTIILSWAPHGWLNAKKRILQHFGC